MLSQTKATKDTLIKCGINKKDLIVRTPFNNKLKGWDNPSICIISPNNYFKKGKFNIFDVNKNKFLRYR